MGMTMKGSVRLRVLDDFLSEMTEEVNKEALDWSKEDRKSLLKREFPILELERLVGDWVMQERRCDTRLLPKL